MSEVALGIFSLMVLMVLFLTGVSWALRWR